MVKKKQRQKELVTPDLRYDAEGKPIINISPNERNHDWLKKIDGGKKQRDDLKAHDDAEKIEAKRQVEDPDGQTKTR